MKIAVISPSRGHLDQMGSVLEAKGHVLALFEGGKSRMRDVAEAEGPDLMLVDGICCDVDELVHVEHVTTHFPATAVILLCSQHTPDFLINSMRAGVREVLPSPVAPAALDAAVNRIAAKLKGTPPRRAGKVLAFVPCKGGSGSTFLATNVAHQLAEAGPVLLVDLNLQFGDALSFVHDGRPPSTVAELATDVDRLDGSLLAASTVTVGPNFGVLAAPEDLAQAMEVKPEDVDAILALAITQYEHVVLDVSRTFDTLTIKALDRAWRIFPVMQATLPDLRHARRLLEAFRSLGYAPEKTEIVVNRFDRGGEIGTDDIRRALGNVRLHTVGNDYREVSASINHGDPISKAARGGTVARQVGDLVATLEARAEPARGLIDRLFRRA